MENENKSGSNAEAESKPGSTSETEKKSDSTKRLIIICVTIVALVGIGVAAWVLTRPSVDIGEGGTPLGYAEGTVALDQSSLQSLVDAMALEDGEFATEYKNVAVSGDGRNFSCYIGNSSLNKYDMYIQIFADNSFTDQVFLSQLLRPGTAFDSVSLDHALDPGVNEVYVVFTQVEDDHATIHGQVTVTMEFTVTE